MVDLDSVFEVSAEVRHRIIDGDAVVVLQDAGEVLILNPTGAVILDAADGVKPLSDIVATIVADFDVTPETAATDALEFAGEMIASGVLLEVSPETTGGE